MKKLAIIAALCAVTMLMVASSAFAMSKPYTHGDFGTDSKGCGDCHVTHSADAAKLLMGRDAGTSTQTAFCLGCHGYLSPFNVKAGVILHQNYENNTLAIDAGRFPWYQSSWAVNNTNSNISMAGGFASAGDFKATVTDHAYPTLKTVTSVHNVRGIEAAVGTISNVTTYEYVYSETASANTIPGGSKNLDFECGSCHDPHAGGQYDDNQSDKNARLLKERLFDSGVLRVGMKIDQATNMITEYTSGMNNWCGGCHNVFNTGALGNDGGLAATDRRTDYYKVGGRDKYMHLFGIEVHDTSKYGGSYSPFETSLLPLSKKEDGSGNLLNITCMTCHRAHGSSATTSTSWKRYAAYGAYSGTGTTTSGTGSALLRLPNRDVCYGCHAEAKFNHSVTHALSATE